MNIIEAYIKFKGQLIIVISGISGCNKTSIAKKVSKNFKIKYINQINYYKEDITDKTVLPNNETIINWYNDDAINWNKFNNDIDTHKKNGIVISAFTLPKEKISFNIDYNIHVVISKKKCMDKINKYIKKQIEKNPEEYDLVNFTTEKLKMNQLIYPYYLQSRENMKINKFINAIEKSTTDLWDEIWDILIYDFIQKYVDWFTENKYFEWKNKSNC